MAFDSLFIGVTGLTSYQNQIDVISNNIANTGTDGFKGQSVNFQDLVYQNQTFGSAPTTTNGGINAQQVGLGVQIGSISTSFAQGGLQTTGVNTDLALDGDGFFVLGNKDGSGIPAYTRNGAFSLNQDGLLYDPASGKAVLGYPLINGTISQTAPPQALQVPIGLKNQAVATGAGAKVGPTADKVYDLALGGNLNQTDYISAVSTAGASINYTTISTTLYDSLGGAHLVQVTFQPYTSYATGPAGKGANLPVTVNNLNGVATTAATEWSYTITPTDGSTFTANTGYMFFDQNGQFINTSGLPIPTAASVHQLGGGIGGGPIANGATTQGNQIEVSQWSTPVGANNASVLTTPGGPIGIDFSNVSSLAGAETANTVSQNGYTSGTLSNITVQQDGTITGSFTNGQNTQLGRLAIAAFQNEQGLSRIGGTQFTASPNSGTPQYGFAAQGRFGSIVAGSLEQSNVSIADEFTKMILAQRSFEANSRSITTADQDLQTVIALKR